MSESEPSLLIGDLLKMVQTIVDIEVKLCYQEQEIKKVWEMNYKINEAFEKRLCAIERQIISLNEIIVPFMQKVEDNAKEHLWFRQERDKSLEQHVRQVDENRKVSRILEELQSKVKALCKTEEIRWRKGYAQFMKDISTNEE